MSHKYRALSCSNSSGDINDLASIQSRWIEKTLPPVPAGHVQIHVNYSSLNYKDALAITGRGKILRHLPLTPGIDACGTITHSESSLWQQGEHVLVTGCGLGETVDGGLSEFITVPEGWVIRKPSHLSLKECMILGTAGFTAGLALHQLQKNGLRPDQGEVLVTGASGGVGALSLLLLKSLNYKTVAWTRKENSFLKTLKVDHVEVPPMEFKKSKPLESAQWAAAIDNVGGQFLQQILPAMRPHSSVAVIGLAQSSELHTTVFPFILRGVNLLGISSATCPRLLREQIWHEINSITVDWTQALSQTLTPELVIPYAESMIRGETWGRTVVDMTH